MNFHRMQTGLIFKPEKPRVEKTGFQAQYLARHALIAGRVHRMQVDAVFEDPNSPWIEYRDTITNYPVRVRKGNEVQAYMRRSHGSMFRWQLRNAKATILNVVHPLVFIKEKK